MKKKYEKKKGFTLIELLAVIALLSIVMGFVIYVAIGYINDSREKTYDATVNNIERIAGNYLIENKDRLFYIPSNDGLVEYQCITIQNLIDTGYFKDDVLESKIDSNVFVMKEDESIYLFNAIDGEEEYFAKSLVEFWDINTDVAPNSLSDEERVDNLVKKYGFDFTKISKSEIRDLIEKEIER